jgi:cadmium resistance protein CadD (predicted permease)
LAATLLSALIVFAATNIDEMLLISLFFADPRLRPQAVVLGQFVGIAALVVASVLSGLAAVAVPAGMLRYAGVVPLLLGLYKLAELRRGAAHADDDQSATLTQASSGIAAQTLSIAGVAIANGSDNLSVYIPLFAAKPKTIPIYVAVFAVMTGVWCAFGFMLVRNRVFSAQLQRYGHIALPVVLILLGLHILSD